MSRGEIHTSQRVGNDNQVPGEIVYFHERPRRVIQAEIGDPFKYKSFTHEPTEP